MDNNEHELLYKEDVFQIVGCAGESYPLFSHFVEPRRFKIKTTIAVKRLVANVIGEDQKNVRTCIRKH